MRLVELVVAPRRSIETHLHPLLAGWWRRRFDVLWIQGFCACHVHGKAQAWRGSDRFNRVDRLAGNVHKRSARSGKRLLPFDLDSHLAFDYRKPFARVRVEAPRQLAARRRGKILGGQTPVVDEQLAPGRLSFVLGLEIREFDPRFVNADITRCLHWLRCPEHGRHRLRRRRLRERMRGGGEAEQQH